MLKKTITYTDFNGEEVSEDFFFHLSKAELIELEVSHKDGLSVAMQRIMDAQDNQALFQEFKKIILMSYGQKSPDGKRFIKNQQLREEFESSEAFSELLMELITADSASKVAEFVNGIIPAGMTAETPQIATQDPVPEPRIVTEAEAEEMPRDEFYAKLRSGEIILDDK